MALTLDELSEAVERLDRGHPAVIEELRAIRKMLEKPGRTLDDICEDYLHRGREWAYQRPWTLPNFGVPDVPGRPKVWWQETCEQWYSVSLEIREAQWWAKTQAERDRINRRRMAA